MSIDGLVIRRAEPSDADDLHAMYSRESAYGGTLQLPHPTKGSWQKRLAEQSDGVFTLVADVGGRVVGTGALVTGSRPRRRHTAGIMLVVHDEWQSRGIGSAIIRELVAMADLWLDITRIELEVYTDNDRAIRLYERFGFEREGTLRQFAFRNGAYADVYYMARLRRGTTP